KSRCKTTFHLYEAEKEKIVSIKEGDAMALPFGVTTRWCNQDDTELVIIFMGNTFIGHKVSNTINILDLIYLVMLDFLFNNVSLNPFIISTNYVFYVFFFSFLYSCFLEILNRIDAGSMCSPGFSCDSSYQVTYIVRGSGRAQIVGIDDKRITEIRVKAGNLFIVPRFFVVSKIDDGEGMEWFSIITTPNPIFSHLAGRTSVWKALSPEVLQAFFNVSPEAEQHFRSKRFNAEIYFPTLRKLATIAQYT
ncbi:hypothetical protein MKX01_029868, partial [Papaver californicum]